ncbi:MAG: hypothetical protein SFV51_10510 [Bryobacteraceae bacterium]|nr:hypothetical protein [Bryobacteraceae bacterium]
MSKTVITRPRTGTEDYHGVTGPRIRCPLCEWEPTPADHWGCQCGHMWHTFDTGGVCPACLHQWTSTQCLSCSGWSAHSAWYEY